MENNSKRQLDNTVNFVDNFNKVTKKNNISSSPESLILSTCNDLFQNSNCNSEILKSDKNNKTSRKCIKYFIDASNLVDESELNSETESMRNLNSIFDLDHYVKSDATNVVNSLHSDPELHDESHNKFDDKYMKYEKGFEAVKSYVNNDCIRLHNECTRMIPKNDSSSIKIQEEFNKDPTMGFLCSEIFLESLKEYLFGMDDEKKSCIFDEILSQFKKRLIKSNCSFSQSIITDKLVSINNLTRQISPDFSKDFENLVHKFLLKQCIKNHETNEVDPVLKELLIYALHRNILSEKFFNNGLQQEFIMHDHKTNIKDIPIFNGSDVSDNANINSVKYSYNFSNRFKNNIDKSTNLIQNKNDDDSDLSVSSEFKNKSFSNKNCEFFIDLKDDSIHAKTPVESCSVKREPLQQKQLFSMFIDFGNSTDSDSSMEMQNRFEKRKKQYLSKIEKSREVRNSLTLSDNTQKSKKSCRITSTASVIPTTSKELSNSDSSKEVTVTKENISVHRKLVSSYNKDYTRSVSPKKLTYSEIEDNPVNESTCETKIGIPNSVKKTKIKNNAICTNNKLTDNTSKSFVKLSDLDNKPKSLILNNELCPSARMTRSATGVELNWFETKLLSGSGNSKSLSRIFPDLSANILNKPNSDVDDNTASSISSIQSSSAISTCDSNLDTSYKNENKIDSNTLGQDLLRMFLDEISPDVIVEVAGRRIKAHKCVLTSRCQYFAALLSGGWVESAGNVLSIQGFSYNAVHFALCYIYSGECEIPDNINIVELATLADTLCLEGLKEVISQTLKLKYCHNFHKPCNVCSVRVLECLPIAVNYGLDEVYRKCLRWITKYYVRLWSTKAFALLPSELIDKCYNQHVANMNVSNAFETLMNCDKLFSFIPRSRWAESCFLVTEKLHDYTVKFLSSHFSEFLKSTSFTSIASNRVWGISIMEEKTRIICNKMNADELCKSYDYIRKQQKTSILNQNQEFVDLIDKVKHQIEIALTKIALQASQCSTWLQMDVESRNQILLSAGITFMTATTKQQKIFSKIRQRSTENESLTTNIQQSKSVFHRRVKKNVTNNISNSNELKQNIKLTKNETLQLNGVSKTNSHNSSNISNNQNPLRNKYVHVKSRYMNNSTCRNEKSNKTVCESTSTDISNIEKKLSNVNKRVSKSLVSSTHLSPAVRQTARATSLSKIPVSVKNIKRIESDSSSGCDSKLTSLEDHKKKIFKDSKIRSVSSRNNNHSEENKKNIATESKLKSNTSVWSRSKRSNQQSILNKSCQNNDSSCNLADDNDSKIECIKSENCSDNNVKRIVPLRRDGTFCIDEPTALRIYSSSVN